MKKLAMVVVLSFGLVGTALAETLIPRSWEGDRGRYYLVEMQVQGNIVKATSKRVGLTETGYTKTETNCSNMTMREMGYSSTSPAAIKSQPTKWFDLVDGSSKSDLAKFVCRRR